MRTPITEAASAVCAACDIYIKALGRLHEQNNEDPEDFYFTKIFKGTWDDPESDGDKEEQDFYEAFDNDPKETAKFALLRIVLITTSYAVQAMKARKNSRLAWSYAVSANYWAGIIRAMPFGDHAGSEAASQLAKRRHAENYALAAEALAYWQKNIDPQLSAQSAANELLKVVPLSHKKLAEIVAEAKRNRRQ